MKYKSEIYEVLHHDAIADFRAGAISESELKEFEDMCFVCEPEPPAYETEVSAVAHVTA